MAQPILLPGSIEGFSLYDKLPGEKQPRKPSPAHSAFSQECPAVMAGLARVTVPKSCYHELLCVSGDRHVAGEQLLSPDFWPPGPLLGCSGSAAAWSLLVAM